MKYVGMHTQIQRNNTLSVLLLLGFPAILLGMVWIFLAILNALGSSGDTGSYNSFDANFVSEQFLNVLPWVIGIVGVWFAIAYFSNTAMIRRATGAHSVTRMENPRLYNIVENLTMTCNMPMPQINIIDDPQLNAFASGIDDKSYTVTVTTGLLDLLDDRELAGVIGHELTHIRNRDTRLLITSIVFVGIISTAMALLVRAIYYMFFYGGGSSRRSSSKDKNSGPAIIVVLIIALVCAAIAYFFTLLTRFAISRKREYMADAGGAELCGDPLALASALRKISDDPALGGVGRDDIAQMYIIHPQALKGGFMNTINKMFSTHPDTAHRIEILEQF